MAGNLSLCSARPQTPRSRNLSRLLRTTAQLSPAAVCWWCGRRPHNNQWDYDHICPSVKVSPGVAACQRCNRSRHGKVPSAEQIQRLLYDDGVIREIGGAEIRQWLRDTAEVVLGDPEQYDLLIAYTWGRPILINGKHHKAANKTFESLGYPTKPDSMTFNASIQNLPSPASA